MTIAQQAGPGRAGLDVVESYLESVFRRGREPMEPIGFTPDWGDQPSRHTTYPDAERIPLPQADLPAVRSAADVLLAGGVAPAETEWDLPALAFVLRSAYATVNRRLRISWNQDSHVRRIYSEAIWGRGAASGGGMYPLEIYLVADDDRFGLLPGVYHYSTAHHELERLAFRPPRRPASGTASAYLAVSARFWKNSFKYNSFCYHVVTQDVGALVEVIRLLADAAGLPVRPQLLFDDQAHDAALGLDPAVESVLALVPLTTGRAPVDPPAPAPATAVRIRPVERSRRVLEFPAVTAVHRALLDAPAREPVERPAGSAPVDDDRWDRRIGLPPRHLPTRFGEIADVVRVRRSSFGSFAPGAGIDVAQLSGILAAGAAATAWDADVDLAGRGRPSIYALVNNMPDLKAGAYAYLPGSHELAVIDERPMADDLQRSYYLSNYNLQEASAVIAVAADWSAARELEGARAYRTVNFAVAAVAQAVNIAASACDVGSGIVLGFDNITIDGLLGLTPPHRRTFLFVILGEDATQPAAYTFDLR